MNSLFWTMRFLVRSLRTSLKDWLRDVQRWREFWHTYQAYQGARGDLVPEEDIQLEPYIRDRTSETPLDVTYYYQDAWAFERIVASNPPWHVDVGSHHKMVSLLSKVISVTMVDIRPLPVDLSSLQFKQGSITDLPYSDDSVPSLSSICVVEHIGLGRYGDPLDPHGSKKAIDELKRVLAPGGKLYISVPVGDTDITYFNAARVFRTSTLLELLKPLEVTQCKYIVGNSFQSEYGPSDKWGTTILLELTKPHRTVIA